MFLIFWTSVQYSLCNSNAHDTCNVNWRLSPTATLLWSYKCAQQQLSCSAEYRRA